MEVFEGSYDPCFSSCLLYAYKNGATKEQKKELLSQLVYQLAPLVSKVASIELNFNIGQKSLDVLKLEALEYLFFVLTEEYIPSHVVDDENTFTRYFWTIIKRGLQSSYNKNYVPAVFDFANIGHEEPYKGRVRTHEDVEIQIYLNQFYKSVLRIAVRDIRFEGKEKKACIYIGRCLLGLLKYHPLSARFKYKINKERALFLVQYMEHLLKVTAHEVKRIDESIGVNEEHRP